MFHDIVGDYWLEAETADALVCTINTTLKKDGTLIMGAGIAAQFADQFEWLPDTWGIRTATMLKENNGRTYPFLEPTEPRDNTPALIGIHTKHNWQDPSPFKLVERSVKQLYIIVRAFNWKRVIMTRPGCELGTLNWEKQVQPLLTQVLDERFIVVHQ